LLDQLGEMLQDLTTGAWMHARPITMIKSGASRRNRGVCISRLRPGEFY
jgi:hypothetical protein